MDKLIEAGKIINTHGVAGDIKAEIWLDSYEFLKKFKRMVIDGDEYRVERMTNQKSFALVHLSGIESLDDAVSLKNRVFYVYRGDAKLPKGTYFINEIIGSRCVDENGTEIGVLEEVLDNPAQMIYVIRGEQEHLIPAVPEFILSTDVENKILTIRMIEGL